MKYAVVSRNEESEEIDVRQVFLRWEEDVLRLYIISPSGREFPVLTIREAGDLFLWGDLPENLGLKLDAQGRIKIGQ